MLVDEVPLDELTPQALTVSAAAATPARARATFQRPPVRALLISDIVSAPFELGVLRTRLRCSRCAASPPTGVVRLLLAGIEEGR